MRGGCEFNSGICKRIRWCLIIIIKGEGVLGVKGINTKERERETREERGKMQYQCAFPDTASVILANSQT